MITTGLCSEIAFLQDSRERFDDRALLLTTPPTTGSRSGRASTIKHRCPLALVLNFGMAGWLALFMHTVGVEIFLRLMPRESERLGIVSCQRQLEAGFSHLGCSGLTVDRWGTGECLLYRWLKLQSRLLQSDYPRYSATDSHLALLPPSHIPQ